MSLKRRSPRQNIFISLMAMLVRITFAVVPFLRPPRSQNAQRSLQQSPTVKLP